MSKDKTERIFIRVSPTEKKEIEKKASLVNKSVANYLITLSKDKRVIDTSKLPPLILEIRRIGVNVNQIATVANSQKYISKELLSKVNENQQEIIKILQQILDEVYNFDEHTFKTLEHKIDKLAEKIERLNSNNGSG